MASETQNRGRKEQARLADPADATARAAATAGPSADREPDAATDHCLRSGGPSAAGAGNTVSSGRNVIPFDGLTFCENSGPDGQPRSAA
jgi:hypothetical protein